MMTVNEKINIYGADRVYLSIKEITEMTGYSRMTLLRNTAKFGLKRRNYRWKAKASAVLNFMENGRN